MIYNVAREDNGDVWLVLHRNRVFVFVIFDFENKMLNKVLKVQTYCAVFNVCLLNYVGKQ